MTWFSSYYEQEATITRRIPEVRIWRMPDNPMQVCFATYHAKANQHRQRPVEKKIVLLKGPLRDDEKSRWRRLRKEILDGLSHQPVGGGALVHVIRRGEHFNRGHIYGIGKTLDYAYAQGYSEQGNARVQIFDSGKEMSDYGRMEVGDRSCFFWIEKAGKTATKTTTIRSTNQFDGGSGGLRG